MALHQENVGFSEENDDVVNFIMARSQLREEDSSGKGSGVRKSIRNCSNVIITRGSIDRKTQVVHVRQSRACEKNLNRVFVSGADCRSVMFSLSREAQTPKCG